VASRSATVEDGKEDEGWGSEGALMAGRSRKGARGTGRR
jgi:hypothetical protein